MHRYSYIGLRHVIVCAVAGGFSTCGRCQYGYGSAPFWEEPLISGIQQSFQYIDAGVQRQAPVAKIEIKELSRLIRPDNAAPGGQSRVEVAAEAFNVALEHNVVEMPPVPFHGFDPFPDEVQVVQPSQVDAAVRRRVRGNAIPWVRLDQFDSPVPTVPLQFQFAETLISDRLEEAIAKRIGFRVADRFHDACGSEINRGGPQFTNHTGSQTPSTDSITGHVN